MASGETSEKDLGPITELINSTKNLQSNRLDLSRQTLVTLPDVLLGLTKLEQLYLDGNLLTELPGTFFESLTSLKWLDLRNNKLRAIPSSIGQHRALRSLLLDRNELQKLPIELGMVKSITGIHLADNPLEFPPKDVVEKGTQEILKFLRSHIPGEEAPQGAESTEEEQPKVQLPKARQGAKEPLENTRSSDEDTPVSLLPPLKWPLPKNTNGNETDEKDGDQSHPERKSNLKTKSRKVGHTTAGIRRETSLQKIHSLKKLDTTDIKQQNSSNQKIEVLTFNGDAKIDRKPKQPAKTKQKKKIKVKKAERVKLHENLADELRFDNQTSFEMIQEVKQMEKEKCLKGPEIHSLLSPRGETEFLEKETVAKADKFDPRLLNKGDMVALRVPPKHFIPGQPCIGQVVGMPDLKDSILLHYYTGSYEGIWRPMMSRSSPYLRRVPAGIIVCKFELNQNGTMSPDTIRKIKGAIGEIT